MKSKNPDKTIKQILDISENLFFTKGYDNTSIQDITDELKMTKGAIYHHFSSKKDIYHAVIQRLAPVDPDSIRNHKIKGDKAIDKIKYAILVSTDAIHYQKIVFSAQSLINNPQILGEVYLNLFTDIAPTLESYLKEGIIDGSITTTQPKSFAQFIAISLNLWVGPRLGFYSKEDLLETLRFVKQACIDNGADILDEEIISSILNLHKELKEQFN